jgi:hypothetical protein
MRFSQADVEFVRLVFFPGNDLSTYSLIIGVILIC